MEDKSRKNRRVDIICKNELIMSPRAYYIYNCYCGTGEESSNGEKMIFCDKCKKWFHTKCTETAKNFSLVKADHDYVFICKKCDKNEQFTLTKNTKTLYIHILKQNLVFLNKFSQIFRICTLNINYIENTI